MHYCNILPLLCIIHLLTLMLLQTKGDVRSNYILFPLHGKDARVCLISSFVEVEKMENLICGENPYRDSL